MFWFRVPVLSVSVDIGYFYVCKFSGCVMDLHITDYLCVSFDMPKYGDDWYHDADKQLNLYK